MSPPPQSQRRTTPHRCCEQHKHSTKGCESIPMHSHNKLLHPGQSLPRIIESVRHGLCAAFTPSFCPYICFMNVSIHKPNLHPLRLQQCPGPNQGLVNQGLHAIQIHHSLAAISTISTIANTPLAPYQNVVRPSWTEGGQNTCLTSISVYSWGKCPSCPHRQHCCTTCNEAVL